MEHYKKEIRLKDVGLNISIFYEREDKILKLKKYLKQQITRLNNKEKKYTLSTYGEAKRDVLDKMLIKLENYEPSNQNL